jgi:hypothetical protein
MTGPGSDSVCQYERNCLAKVRRYRTSTQVARVYSSALIRHPIQLDHFLLCSRFPRESADPVNQFRERLEESGSTSDVSEHG